MDKATIKLFGGKLGEHTLVWVVVIAIFQWIGFDNVKAFASDQLNQGVNQRIDQWEAQQRRDREITAQEIKELRRQQREDAAEIRRALWQISIGATLQPPAEENAQ